MLARLDAGDGGVARPHPLGELLLREAELGPAHDHDARDALVGRQAFVRRAIGRVLPPTACG
jgi:hypothetical protein